MELQKIEFEAWLRGKASQTADRYDVVVGYRDSINQCPLANWLSEKVGDTITVTKSHYRRGATWDIKNNIPLPPWARDYVYRTDCRRLEIITAHIALYDLLG